MLPSRSLVKILCVLFTLVTTTWGLRIGAFNVRVFGSSKASKDDVMDILSKIAVRYDILLIQEIKDKSGKAIHKLLDRIHQNHGVTMSLIISDRLGRNTSKEQYAFLYRKDRGITVVGTLHYPDGDEASGQDLFSREPFIVRFQAINSKVKEFSLVALHTAPLEAVKELTSLYGVVQYVRNEWNTADILVLGDLNADCSYVPKKAWPEMELRQDPHLLWLIGDEVDTTVNANTDCAYDRFIVAGSSLQNAVLPGSASVFDFQEKYGLTEDQALAVSDHYPIELTLQDGTQHDGSSNGANGHSSVAVILRRLWDRTVKKFARWRSDSDL